MYYSVNKMNMKPHATQRRDPVAPVPGEALTESAVVTSMSTSYCHVITHAYQVSVSTPTLYIMYVSTGDLRILNGKFNMPFHGHILSIIGFFPFLFLQ